MFNSKKYLNVFQLHRQEQASLFKSVIKKKQNYNCIKVKIMVYILMNNILIVQTSLRINPEEINALLIKLHCSYESYL